jgi:methyl-accepting chemotaxis protein
MLNKIKIGPKLIGGFLIVALIAGIIGIIGIINLKTLDSEGTMLYEKMTVPISYLSDVSTSFQRVRINSRDIIYANDPKEIDKYSSTITELSEKISLLIKDYEKCIITDDMKKAFEEFNTVRVGYRENLSQIVQLAKANKDAEAYSILFGDAKKTAMDEQSAIDNMIELKVAEAKKTSDNNTATARSATMTMIMTLITGIILSLFLGIFLTLSITRPVNEVVKTAKRLAEEDLSNLTDALTAASIGDLSKSVDVKTQELVIKSEDEIGILGNTFNQMIAKFQQSGKAVAQLKASLEQVSNETLMLAKSALDGQLATRGDVSKFKGTYREMVDGLNKTLDAVVNPINETNIVLQKVTNRDMTVRVKGDYKGDMEKLKIAVNSTVGNLDTALQQVAQGAEAVASASQQISAGSQSLAQGANEQASSLEEVSSSLEEMASMTKQNADNANQAKTLASEANGNAAQGKQAMARMSDAINKIKDSSDQTAKIVKTIDEIAMQTNLLALNAAVEAARAGEAGRGFAVVAEEVRNLAQRSAQAAKNTADMIAESVKNSEEGVKIATDVAKSFESIAGSNAKVDSLIAEIAAASQEQSQGIDQVNTAVAQMDKVTQLNAANSEESASAAEELSSQAEELQNMVAQFTLSNAGQQTLVHTKPVLEHKTMQLSNGDNSKGRSSKTTKSSANHQGKERNPKQIMTLEDDDVLKDF